MDLATRLVLSDVKRLAFKFTTMSSISRRRSNRPTKAQRRAQSQRDRARNEMKSGGSLHYSDFKRAGIQPPRSPSRARSRAPRRLRESGPEISTLPTAINVYSGVNDQSVTDTKRLSPNDYGAGIVFPFSTKYCDVG